MAMEEVFGTPMNTSHYSHYHSGLAVCGHNLPGFEIVCAR
jgi:hypothetical protein